MAPRDAVTNVPRTNSSNALAPEAAEAALDRTQVAAIESPSIELVRSETVKQSTMVERDVAELTPPNAAETKAAAASEALAVNLVRPNPASTPAQLPSTTDEAVPQRTPRPFQLGELAAAPADEKLQQVAGPSLRAKRRQKGPTSTGWRSPVPRRLSAAESIPRRLRPCRGRTVCTVRR